MYSFAMRSILSRRALGASGAVVAAFLLLLGLCCSDPARGGEREVLGGGRSRSIGY